MVETHFALSVAEQISASENWISSVSVEKFVTNFVVCYCVLKLQMLD